MNAKKKSAKKSATRNAKVDPKLAEKLLDVAKKSRDVEERQRANRLAKRALAERGSLLAMCCAPKTHSGQTRYLAHREGATGIITEALNGRASKRVIEMAAGLIAQSWAAFAACLTDLGEADGWRALDTKRVVAAHDILAAAERQADGTGPTSRDLPPFAGTDIVEVAAPIFDSLLAACTKLEKPPSEVAPVAVKSARAALREVIASNPRLADWIWLYFAGAEAALGTALLCAGAAEQPTSTLAAPTRPTGCSFDALIAGLSPSVVLTEPQRSVLRVLHEAERGEGYTMKELVTRVQRSGGPEILQNSIRNSVVPALRRHFEISNERGGKGYVLIGVKGKAQHRGH